jgi:hypothetical protein
MLGEISITLDANYYENIWAKITRQKKVIKRTNERKSTAHE